MKSTVPVFSAIVILVGALFVAFEVQPIRASGTIYIRSDGSVDPSGVPITRTGNTYTFTNNISDSIQVQRSNIVVDGNGYALLGSGNLTGVFIEFSVNNVTIRNMIISYFDYGIYAYRSSFDTFSGNRIAENNYGIYLYNSSDTDILENNITTNEEGIRSDRSSSTNITGNTITANSFEGIVLVNASDNSISRNNVRNGANASQAIVLEYSTKNSISENNITANSDGINLGGSTNNTISGNNVTGNANNGIALSESSSNKILENDIKANYLGIELWTSLDNDISGNNITSSETIGILLYSYSSSNNIFDNGVIGNDAGIICWFSSDNFIFHNNFIDNSYAFQLLGLPTETWDNGYPSGGNYWSNYNGTDIYRGTYQNTNGSDGIGDTSYVLGSNNTDRYPLMGPTGSSTQTGQNVTVFPIDEVCVIFETITEEGLTVVDKPGTGPAPPSGISILQYYVIETTADYWGQILIKILYYEPMGKLGSPTQEDLRLLQCIMITGDIDEDFDVDIFDLVTMAGVYGVAKPDPRYVPNCDLDNDDDIDIFDVVRLAANYGKTWDPETGWADITTWFDPETNSIFGVTIHVSIFGVTRS